MTTNPIEKTPAESGEQEKLLLRVSELATLLDAQPRTLWRWLASGDLIQPIKIGGSTRWRAEEVRAWINTGCPKASDWEYSASGGVDRWRPSVN